MLRWKRAEATVERLLASGDLDAIRESASDGSVVLEQAKRRLRVAFSRWCSSGAFTFGGMATVRMPARDFGVPMTVRFLRRTMPRATRSVMALRSMSLRRSPVSSP